MGRLHGRLLFSLSCLFMPISPVHLSITAAIRLRVPYPAVAMTVE